MHGDDSSVVGGGFGGYDVVLVERVVVRVAGEMVSMG